MKEIISIEDVHNELVKITEEMLYHCNNLSEKEITKRMISLVNKTSLAETDDEISQNKTSEKVRNFLIDSLPNENRRDVNRVINALEYAKIYTKKQLLLTPLDVIKRIRGIGEKGFGIIQRCIYEEMDKRN